jgi:hypothetical protein
MLLAFQPSACNRMIASRRSTGFAMAWKTGKRRAVRGASGWSSRRCLIVAELGRRPQRTQQQT